MLAFDGVRSEWNLKSVCDWIRIELRPTCTGIKLRLGCISVKLHDMELQWNQMWGAMNVT